MTIRTVAAICVVVTGVVTSSAESQSKSAPPFKAAHGAFFALSVADLRESTTWYSEKFGLEIVMHEPRKPGDRGGFAVLEGGGLTVELVQADGAVPLNKVLPSAEGPQMLYGFFKAGFSVEDFDAAVAALKVRGVEIAYGPFPARDGRPANVIVKDNAGNWIQLFGSRSGCCAHHLP